MQMMPAAANAFGITTSTLIYINLSGWPKHSGGSETSWCLQEWRLLC